ncbi:MAG: hypothetical protein LBL96_08855 [Clostridiales bacterium]|jgi:hypothetical protein|nr:hypothetical protein [Clostridiales bacterium]
MQALEADQAPYKIPDHARLEHKKEYFGVFAPRKRLIKRLEDESDFFFEKLESVKNFFLRNFYGQVISCVMGDVNDFCGLNAPRNVFYRQLRFMDISSRRALYKMTAMYHTIHYLASGMFKCDDPIDMLETIKDVFELDEHERLHFSIFADTFWQCEGQFEVEFSRYAAKRVFGRARIRPSSLAYVSYYFMSSYSQFITFNQNYVA